MKFYVSSYRLGNEPEKLAAMVAGGRRGLVIVNAWDLSNDQERRQAGIARECSDMERLGIRAEALDLRPFFGRSEALREHIDRADMLWVVGGNTFVLRRAFAYSGLDQILWQKQLDEAFVYAGYSAGVCLLALTLRGLHIVDDPYAVPEGYQPETLWDGLGLLPYSIAPHYHSNHPESGGINLEVDYMIEHKILFKALRDGEVIIIE